MITLIKGFKKFTSVMDFNLVYNQLIGDLDSNFRTIETKINSIELLQLITYTTSTRPDPSRVPVGSCFFNTTTGIPNFSNGVNWINAAGTIV